MNSKQLRDWQELLVKTGHTHLYLVLQDTSIPVANILGQYAHLLDASTATGDSVISGLNECKAIIGNLCHQGRPPSMSIPARPDRDEDFIMMDKINTAIQAYQTMLAREKALRKLIDDLRAIIDAKAA